jgi:hypothetical protein
MTTNINQIFIKLKNEAGRLAKEAILKENASNELLKKVINLALNPFIHYNIKKIPKPSVDIFTEPKDLDTALNDLNSLVNRTYTGNAASQYLSKLLGSLSTDNQAVLIKVVLKDLDCGVNVSTVNRVWPNFIPDYPCMLCEPFSAKLADKIKFPAVAQHKLDGMRFNALLHGGKVEFRARSGKLIDLSGSPLETKFASLGLDRVVFDGELLALDSAGNVLPRQTGNGIISKAQKGTATKEDLSKISCVLWDYIPLKDFKAGKSELAYSERFSKLKLAVKESNLEIVTSFDINNIDEAQELSTLLIKEGHEGIILKDCSGIWENKRVKHQLKFKAELECDLIVTEISEGTGKYTGMIGALVCESADGMLKVNVSGLTDAQRASDIYDFIGKVVSVKYNAKIKDSVKGTWSLFLPRFVEVRDDKESADCLEKIA